MRETNDIWKTRWSTLAQRWRHHLADAGLGEITQAVGHAFKPLAPFAAQVLWVTQPGFALFGHSEAVDALAEMLDSSQFAVNDNQPTEVSSQAAGHKPGTNS